MNENLAIDGNTKNTLGAVTNDANAYIRRLLVNPETGALLCEANVTSSNTMIGSTIPGSTQGSVLFIGPGGTLAQDNTEFFWDDANDFLGLGTDTPAATLHVSGSAELDLGADAVGDTYYRGVSGKLVNLGIGTSGQQLTVVGGVPAWSSAGGSSGYDLFQNQGSSVTQRSTVNLTNLLTASDIGGKTQLTINTANLANDSTFITALSSNATFLSDVANSSTFVNDLIANATFTTNLANDPSFVTALTSNATFQSDVVTFINSSGSLSVNLSTQVMGVLPVAHGGTGDSSLTAYALLFGGTTSTSPVQSGTVGSAGQVLTSNGAGSVATFQTPTIPGANSLITAQTGGAGVTIPAGTPGTTGMVQATYYFSKSGGTTVDSDIAVTYGGQTICSFSAVGNGAGTFNSIAPLIIQFFSTGTANAQHSNAYLSVQTTSGGTIITNVFETANSLTVDSTVTQTLAISVTNNVAGLLAVDSTAVTAFS